MLHSKYTEQDYKEMLKGCGDNPNNCQNFHKFFKEGVFKFSEDKYLAYTYSLTNIRNFENKGTFYVPLFLAIHEGKSKIVRDILTNSQLKYFYLADGFYPSYYYYSQNPIGYVLSALSLCNNEAEKPKLMEIFNFLIEELDNTYLYDKFALPEDYKSESGRKSIAKTHDICESKVNAKISNRRPNNPNLYLIDPFDFAIDNNLEDEVISKLFHKLTTSQSRGVLKRAKDSTILKLFELCDLNIESFGFNDEDKDRISKIINGDEELSETLESINEEQSINTESFLPNKMSKNSIILCTSALAIGIGIGVIGTLYFTNQLSIGKLFEPISDRIPNAFSL